MDKYFVERLRVENFRNLPDAIFEFDKGINCLYGQNGIGKTNILEALYFLINRKSFRKKVSFPQLLSVECEKPEIFFQAVAHLNARPEQFSGKLSEQGAAWFFNNKPEKKRPQKRCFIINPFDSYSFHSQSSYRRAWIESHFARISGSYQKLLSRFNKFLKIRNALLSSYPINETQLISLDKEFCETIYALMENKKKLIALINEELPEIFAKIFHQSDELQLELSSIFSNKTVTELIEYYQKQRSEDKQARLTKNSPHLDDYVLKFNGFDSKVFCSMGQQKLAFLALFFRFLEVFEKNVEMASIALIDDVSGELDSLRLKNLIDYLQACNRQILITTANDGLRNSLEKNTNIIDIGSFF